LTDVFNELLGLLAEFGDHFGAFGLVLFFKFVLIVVLLLTFLLLLFELVLPVAILA